ncbi:sulfurtransferase [Helicobacter cetorum]|uniref:Rhodanese-related sulfur transferase n=1 Tax=Helicobacter cetorum (strain ATCC BAA-540 / CCUG 52418 / MIT 99-5656) TaxID=1163745 RepID=I0ERK7_HELCM|nr:rhodanese-like domain-containing protein [Helicobacter cetorum]AFI05576.1 rhodanese-related sulfur transferase [Helicobacter cetorum MIT 99-5656]
MDFLNLDNFKNILFEKDTTIIDTREACFFHGFKEKGALRGGHVKNALRLRSLWLERLKDKTPYFLYSKGALSKNRIVLYGEKSEIKALKPFFKTPKILAFENFMEYQNDFSNPLEKLKNYHYSLSPSLLYQKLQEEDCLIFEVGHASLKQSTEHVLGALYLDTDILESPPLYNLNPIEVLQEKLSELGVSKDSSVVLYSSSVIAALRVFFILQYAGVKKVQFLDGGLEAWKNLNLPTSKHYKTPKRFFSALKPCNSFYLSLESALKKQKKGYKLVSIRSWEEYQAQKNDYAYIERKGEIPGALWGFSGSHYSNACDFYNPDNTLRNPYEIYKLWEQQGFNRYDKVIFYCSTGWRGAVAWFYALLNGWDNAFLCDGGWHEYQSKGFIARENALKIPKPSANNGY